MPATKECDRSLPVVEASTSHVAQLVLSLPKEPPPAAKRATRGVAPTVPAAVRTPRGRTARQAHSRARGIFVTIEGIDGAGKTTQARLVARWLRRRGWDVLLTREPGGTALGRKLRRALLDDGAPVSPPAELMLYAADRAQHVAEVIRPALAQGRAVVCERFCDSTVAYQGYGRRLDLGLVQRLNDYATGGLETDLTILLNISPQAARGRLAKTPDRLERERLAFHLRVAAGYRKLAQAHPERIKVVDAAAAPEQVCCQVTAVLEAFLSAPRAPHDAPRETRNRKGGNR